jgi:hypothetical protein
MERPNIIERAFSLAEKCGSIDEVKQQLKREGYLQVDAHLSGRQIRSEIMGRLSPALVKGRRLSRAEKSENGA